MAKNVPPDEEENKTLVNKALFVVGGFDDALGTVDDVYKTNDRRRNTKKKGALKATFNIKLISSLLNKKRTRNILKLLTGKDLRGLTGDNARVLGMIERALRGDMTVFAKLLPSEYQQLFTRLAKIDSLQKRIFHTKSGKRSYTKKQLEKRNRADSLQRNLVTRRNRSNTAASNGIRSITDIQVESQIYGDVLRDYSELDDPEEVISIIREVNDNRDLQKEIAVVASGDLANNGHVDAINTLIDESIITITDLVNRYPDIVLRIVKGFKINYNDRLIPIKQIGGKILTLLNKINPEWNLMLRGNSKVINFKLYQLMSKDCSNAIIAYEWQPDLNITSSIHTAPAVIGANITTIALESLLAKQFPEIPFSFKTK
jgi:hypothetical protein